jgi:uncharacterized repeat protein (TIGR02543 family)
LAEFTDVASVPNAEFYVEPGDWDFTVEGYKESVVVLSGSLTSQAIPATGANLALNVSPVSGADGTVKISIQLPSDSGITSAQIIKEGDNVGTYYPDASGLVVFEADYPAGVYYIVVKLYNDDELYGVFSETYYVWAHLLSEKTYTPAREDLNSIYTVELDDWHEVNGDVSSTHEAYYRRTDAALTLPAPPMWTDTSGDEYVFRGWYADVSHTGSPITTIPAGSTGNQKFYAYWELVTITVSGETLEDALYWIKTNAAPVWNYIIRLTQDETTSAISQELLIYTQNVEIKLVGDVAGRTVTLGGTGSLLTVGSGVTLILDANISLEGISGNNAALVKVNSGGTLVMETGSKISGNTNSSNGGGVYVNSGGTFTMSGGEISSNTGTYGGGGVYVAGTFEMSDGEISSNTGTAGGGGVYVSSGTFTMSGGKISSNTGTYGSGGVYVDNSRFEMSGGEISGNTNTSTSSNGGGVMVLDGTFTKTSNGTIYGSNATDGLKNTAGSGEGHAVYVYNGSTRRKRNDTAGEGVILDSTKTGMAGGGWEDALSEALSWLATNAVDNGNYTITVYADESMTKKTFDYGLNNVSITLISDTTRTISLSNTGSLLTVGTGVTLTLGANISLVGISDNTAALVTVNSGGTLVMQTDSKISGNTNTNGGAGGVLVYGGTFAMSGGEISGNTANGYGGGVYVYSGRFEMRGGKISSNTANDYGGGGVYVYSGTFEMRGGEISGNTATTYGGGVLVNSGTFTKTSNGTIYGSNETSDLKNTAGSGEGHAAYVYNGMKKRDSTAGESVALDSTKSGMAGGGWEDTLSEALSYLATNAVDNGNYTITVYADESMIGKTLDYGSKNVSITLIGNTTRTISLSNTGSLLTVGNGITLTLGANISLVGISGNSAALVTVNSGGTLVMETDSKISGNNGSSNGGGVYVNGGTFTMSGGEISGNTSTYGYGGGVYVYSGTFTKSSNGTIYGSDATDDLKNTAQAGGHAVFDSNDWKYCDITAGTGFTLDSTNMTNWSE